MKHSILAILLTACSGDFRAANTARISGDSGSADSTLDTRSHEVTNHDSKLEWDSGIGGASQSGSGGTVGGNPSIRYEGGSGASVRDSGRETLDAPLSVIPEVDGQAGPTGGTGGAVTACGMSTQHCPCCKGHTCYLGTCL